MTLLASDILDSAATTLLDEDGITYPAADMLGYLNEALRATAFVKPDMYTKQEFVTLAAGVLQSIPADGVALLDIQQNEASGRIVSQVDLQLLDEASRFWPAGTQQAEVEHFTADPRTPRRFKVYPPNDGTGSVEVLYGAVPPALTSAGDSLVVADSYQNALINFVISKGYGKTSKKQDLVKEANAMNAWRVALGLKSQAQVGVAPKVASQPGVA